MSTSKRLLILMVVLTIPVWAAATATGKPPCPSPPCKDEPPPEPSGSVEVTVEQNLRWVHEAGDQIYYTIVVENGTDGEVTVADRTGEVGTVAEQRSETFSSIYTVVQDDIPPPPPPGTDIRDFPTWDVINEVTVSDDNGVELASAWISAEATYYEPCDVDNQPFTIGTWACIWKPVPGTYDITLTPNWKLTSPTSAYVTVRDHIPGSYCGEIGTHWNPRSDPDGPFSLTLTVTIPPEPTGLPDPWIGLESQCGSGTIGQSGSFYLVADGEVTRYVVSDGQVTITEVADP